MITKEEIKKVEKLQELKRQKMDLKEDYRNISSEGIQVDTCRYARLNYRSNYIGILKIAIKNKIRIIDKKI